METITPCETLAQYCAEILSSGRVVLEKTKAGKAWNA